MNRILKQPHRHHHHQQHRGRRHSFRNVFCCIRLAIFVYVILVSTDAVDALRRGNLLTPQNYSPLNGDLNIQLQYFSQQKQSKEHRFDDASSLSHRDSDDDEYNMKTTAAPTPATALENPLYGINDDIRLHVSRYTGINRTTVAIIDVYPDPRSNITQITISCMSFLFGGTYELEIVGGNDIDDSANKLDDHDERLKKQLDVRWPQPKLSVTPESIGTYPQQAVDVILEFPGLECIVPHSQIDNVPEFWLELYYCGHEVYCDNMNVSSSQVLYAEQVRGYPKARLVKLSCELFGLAGHYVVKLRPVAPVSPIVTATAYIKADWSEQFVFNVHARSISPCDPHTGIGVLFEYPECILDRADRIRLFGKLRADVASLVPPTTLHYITEQRVIRGQHALHFDCDYFSEKYVEYCFVYVSQAISGAVADIRMDCLPTLPVRDSDVGGWGEWSDWTPCSTTCASGTRSRYRVCDNPPPRYGAMFCEGSAVETEDCGSSISDSWECIYAATGSFLPSDLPAEKPEIKADVGSDCRCGCIVHLSVLKSRRIIAASAQSCPGRTFWLIQADPGFRIRFHFDFFRLICADQYIRVRDGDSLASDLIGEFVGGSMKSSDAIVSSDSKLLLEFYSNELSTIGQSCKGGFLTHAQQIKAPHPNITAPHMSKAVVSTMITPTSSRITMVHIIAILFSSLIIIVSAFLLAQYIFRYRKYQLAESAGEPDSPAHTPRTSMGSIPLGQVPSRAVSTSTLLSEVVSFVKIRPRGRWMKKHSRLRESVDAEALQHALQTKKAHSDDDEEEEDAASLESTHTLTNETFNESNDACETGNVTTTPLKRKKHNQQQQQKQQKANCENSNEALSQHLSTSPSTSCGSGEIDSKDDDGVDDDRKNDVGGRRFYKRRESSSNSNSISLPRTPLDTPMPARRNAAAKKRNYNNHNGAKRANFSNDKDKQQAVAAPANNRQLRCSTANGDEKTAKNTSNDNCNGSNKSNCSSGSDGMDDVSPSETKSVNGKASKGRSGNKKRNCLNLANSNPKMRGEDSDSLASVNKCNDLNNLTGARRHDAMRKLSVSNATLRNMCYSPASSIISVSTNRSANIKESKEKRNREKLLAGPGSEFSLANPEDLEMDYYDYNVINAGAAPGSYLGMDPQYLVWIPPLDDNSDAIDGREFEGSEASDSEDNSDESEPHYDEVSPTYENSKHPPSTLTQKELLHDARNNIHDANKKAVESNKILAVNAFSEMNEDDLPKTKEMRRKSSSSSLIKANLLLKKAAVVDAIQMTEFKGKKRFSESPVKVHNPHAYHQSRQQQDQHRHSYASDDKDNDTEKETAVVKSPSDNATDYYTELDDIQFADDDDDEEIGEINYNCNRNGLSAI